MNPNNVTPIESKQPQAAARFTITATIDGFPIQIEFEGGADSLRSLVSRLKAIGATPPQASQPEPTKQNGAPLCPIHNSPMKPSRKPGKFYCAKKVGDDYCREVA
jgi:hypothetical protein